MRRDRPSAAGEQYGGKRVLVYSQDGLGLGHLRRSFTIAAELAARAPDAAILVISDSPAPPFAPPAGVDYLKLPTVVKEDDALWRAGSLNLDAGEILRLRASIVLEVYTQFRPDTILVDHMPVGALGELKPLLHAATKSRPRPGLFLGLRDVLGRPMAIRQAWQELGVYDYLGLYDGVLVYGCCEIHDAGAAYDMTAGAAGIYYANYVAKDPVPRISNGSTPPSEPFVLMVGGGGHDAFPLADAFLRALPHVAAESELHAVIVTGPNMPTSEQHALHELAGSPRLSTRVRVARALPDTAAWMQQASAVVSMGGYNSLCEILTWHRRAVIVPRSGPSDEQGIRSRLFAQRGLVRMIEPYELTPERLASELSETLVASGLPNLARIPPLDGAKRAASVLLDGIEAVEATETAQGQIVAQRRPQRDLVAEASAETTPTSRSGPRCHEPGC